MPLFPEKFYELLSSLFGSSAPSFVLTVLEPSLQAELIRHGILSVGDLASGRIADSISSSVKLREGLSAFLSAVNEDDPESLIDALAAFFQKPPPRDPFVRHTLLHNIKVTLLPIAVRVLGDDALDQLYGSLGSKAVLAKAIARVYAPYGVSGDKAFEYADILYKLFQNDPTLKQGFTNKEIAEIIEEATKQGLLAPSQDLKKFTDNLFNILRLSRYTGDALVTVLGVDFDQKINDVKEELIVLKSKRDSTTDPKEKASLESDISRLESKLEELQKQKEEHLAPEKLVQKSTELLKHFPGIPLDKATEYIAADVELRRRYPYGAFQAGLAVEAGLPQLPATTQEGTGYTQLDEKLQQNAARSFLGQALGATVRAVEKMGVREGPLYDLYLAMKEGKEIERFTPLQWIDMAMQSGLSRATAFNLLRQRSANSAVMLSDPQYLRFLRMHQYKFDIAPIISFLRKRFGNNEELLKGALAELASKWGYQGVGALDAGDVMMIMTSPLVNNQAYKAVQEAMERGKIQIDTQHINRVPFTRRVIDLIKEIPTKGFDLREITKKLLNIYELRREGTPEHEIYKFYGEKFTTPGGFFGTYEKEEPWKPPEKPEQPPSPSLPVRDLIRDLDLSELPDSPLKLYEDRFYMSKNVYRAPETITSERQKAELASRLGEKSEDTKPPHKESLIGVRFPKPLV